MVLQPHSAAERARVKGLLVALSKETVQSLCEGHVLPPEVAASDRHCWASYVAKIPETLATLHRLLLAQRLPPHDVQAFCSHEAGAHIRLDVLRKTPAADLSAVAAAYLLEVRLISLVTCSLTCMTLQLTACMV